MERARAAWILLAGGEQQKSFKNLPKIGAAEKKHKSHMKTKRGVWAFQPAGFGSGKVPPKGDPKGQSVAGGASARQASLRGCGPAAAAPQAWGRTEGARRSPRGPGTPGVPFRGGGGHCRAPRKAAGAAGLGACQPSPHAAQHGEKKARPPPCIRGHGTLAGQNAGHTGHPPSLALPRALLPAPRNASITSAPAGGFSSLLIAMTFTTLSHPPTPIRHAALPPLLQPGAPRISPAGCPGPPRPFPHRPSSGGAQRGARSTRRRHPVLTRARGCRGRGAGVYEPPASKWPPSSS